MNINRSVRSPNFSDLEIPVRFVVLHYTAASLERTLEIFTTQATEVSAHIVIDRDGTVYELVDCLSGICKRAWHAGRSRLELPGASGGTLVEGFNDCSIGIELVNLNGNIFQYSEAQYASLFALIESLKAMYPALNAPESVIGHEQIAGFRGKCDPGRCFEWSRLFSVCYPNQGAPERRCLCPESVAARLRDLVVGLGVPSEHPSGETLTIPPSLPKQFFGLLSAFCEGALAERDSCRS
jgi:N-acetylmuramoyl-L-alanine amidase